METVVLLVSTAIVSTGLTWFCRGILLRQSVIDVPNPRSSHDRPVPRGGGIAIIVIFLPFAVYLRAKGLLPDQLLVPLVLGGFAVGLIGLADDFATISPWWRLLVHIVAAGLAVAMIGPLPGLMPPDAGDSVRWLVLVLIMLAIVWHLNLFNFMDGIDGIAGSQAVFVCVGATIVGWSGPGAPGANLLLLGLAAVTAGFLVWNWPPAKIFMGDVGSGFLGYVLAVIAVHSVAMGALSVWSWIILLSAFVLDATVTLIRRLFRQERIFQAHRSHTYQRLARRLASHGKVTVGLWLVNLVWLLPLAVQAEWHRELGPVLAVIAALPVLAVIVASARASDD